jgi:hypothetical protein
MGWASSKSRAPVRALAGAPHVAQPGLSQRDTHAIYRHPNPRCQIKSWLLGRRDHLQAGTHETLVPRQSTAGVLGPFGWRNFRWPDRILLRKVPVVRMPQNEQETAPEPLKPEEVTELQALLQTDKYCPGG